METLQLKIEGMHCDGCVRSVTRMLSSIPGVDRVEVSLTGNSADLSYDPAKTGVAEFRRAVERAGFKAP